MPRLDLDDLGLFRHIAEAGSITAGAARANLALAAASARVRGMEAVLGARLLERGRHGVTLTPAGHALLAHARALLAQAERMHEELAAHAGGGGAGHVRMLSNTNALTEHLPEALGRFLAAHPQVTVDLQERLSDEIVGLVAEGAAGLGIVAATADMGGLQSYPFRTDRFVLVVPEGHALTRRERIAFAEVLDLDLVGLDEASALQRFLAAREARLGRRPRLRVRLRSFDAVCRMVEAGAGTASHLALIGLAESWGTRMTHVPYRGGAPALTAVAGGEVDLTITGATQAQPFAVRGQMRPIAVTGPRRLAALPDVPTFRELGWPGADAGTWQALLVQGGTPRATVERIAREARAALAQPAVLERLAGLGAEPRADGPDALREWLDRETETYTRLIRANDITLD